MSPNRIIATSIATLLVADVALLSARSTEDGPAPVALPTATVNPGEGGPGPGRSTKDPEASAAPTAATDPTPGRSVVAFPDLPYLPPDQGRYRYSKTTTVTDPQGQTDEAKGVEVYDFRKPKVRGGAVRQVVEVREKGSSAAEIITNEWRRAGLVRLERYVGGDRNSTCTYDPPQLIIPFPLKEGTSFDAGSGRCAEAGPEPETSDGVETTESHSVTRTETLTIAGERLECFVIEESSLTTFDTAQGKGRSESTTVKWFSPKYRLFVQIEVTIEGEFSGQGGVLNGSYSSESTRVLISPQPA